MLQLLRFFGAKIIVYSIRGSFHVCTMHERENHARSMHGMVDCVCTMHVSCMEYVETCMFHVQNFQQGDHSFLSLAQRTAML